MKFYSYELLNLTEDNINYILNNKPNNNQIIFSTKHNNKLNYYFINPINYNGYLCLEVKYNATDSYSDILINKLSEQITNNNRPIETVEPNSQFFVVYKNNHLFISDHDKKTFVKDFLLKEVKNNRITIKNIICSAEEFFEKVKEVNNMLLVIHEPSILVNQPSDMCNALSDQYGYDQSGISHKIEITGNYDKKIVKQHHKDLGNNGEKFQKLVGKDDNNFEMIFNAEGFNQKIEVKLKKDSNNFYNPKEVYNKLIEKINDILGV